MSRKYLQLSQVGAQLNSVMRSRKISCTNSKSIFLWMNNHFFAFDRAHILYLETATITAILIYIVDCCILSIIYFSILHAKFCEFRNFIKKSILLGGILSLNRELCNISETRFNLLFPPADF